MASVTIANTDVETTVFGSGIGSRVFPAGFLTAGRSIRIIALGFESSSGSPTIRIRIKLNSTTVLDSTAKVSSAGTNSEFRVTADLTVRSEGANGSIIGQGDFYESGNTGADADLVNTIPTTIDTTVAQTLDVTVQWGTASNNNTITTTNVFIDVCG